MATNNTTKRSSNGRQRVERVERTDSESARWIAGLVIIFVGFFAAAFFVVVFFAVMAPPSVCSTLKKRHRKRVGFHAFAPSSYPMHFYTFLREGFDYPRNLPFFF